MACTECKGLGFVNETKTITSRVTGNTHKNVVVARRCSKYKDYFREISEESGSVADCSVIAGPHICDAAIKRHEEIIDYGGRRKSAKGWQ